MASIEKNEHLKGIRGNLGKQFVYKQYGDKTVIAKMPEFRSRKPTAAEAKRRSRFADAVAYASAAIKDPLLKKAYQQAAAPFKRAYNVALRDYLYAPAVEKIDLSEYGSHANSQISIIATDDFRVAKVTVTILDEGENLMEEGDAILDAIDQSKWIYKTKTVGAFVKVRAWDLAGNVGEGKSER